MTTTHRLETDEAGIAYDVHGPLPTADERPPLFMIGQPMDASGFGALASHVPDRTVVTYDPRGLGCSTREDGRVDNAPTVQAGDVHAVIRALGADPRRDRGGGGVPGHLHRTHVAGHRRAARSAGDGVPEPPRRLPRRRVRVRRPAQGLRAETARSPQRRQLTMTAITFDFARGQI